MCVFQVVVFFFISVLIPNVIVIFRVGACIVSKLYQCNKHFFVDTPASPSGSDRKPRRFRLLSSRSGSREESGIEREGPTIPNYCPVVEQEASPIFKERFVPPDLSIWDYFITKVIQNINNDQTKNMLKLISSPFFNESISCVLTFQSGQCFICRVHLQ